MDLSILAIESDQDGVDAKYNNFEKAVDHLANAIPIAKDSLRSLKAVETAKGGDDEYPKDWDHAGRSLTDAQRKSEAQNVPFWVWKKYPPDKKARITSDRIRFGIKPNAKRNEDKAKDGRSRFKSDHRRENARMKAANKKQSLQIASLKASLAAAKGIGNDGNSCYDSDSSEANPGAIKRGGRKRSEAAEASSKHRKKSN